MAARIRMNLLGARSAGRRRPTDAGALLVGPRVSSGPMPNSSPHSQSAKSARALDAWRSFYDTSLDASLKRCLTIDPDENALAIFRSAAQDVPAYRSFLSTHGVHVEDVRTIEDFRRLPVTTKENYHRKSALHELCRDGSLVRCDFLAVSSGSTGEPTIWPRFVADEVGSAQRFEQVLADSFAAQSRSTLAVVCFALGSWVGGMYTAACCRHVAAKGYPLTVVTPGNLKGEILRVLRTLAPLYDQVVLFGYPPFLKDVIDEGKKTDFDWSRYTVGVVMAGEVFSGAWRTGVAERMGARDPTHATASLYGTADGGVLANETPYSIEIRRFLADHSDAARELFGEPRLPTLCQYDPLHRYFEREDDGSLLFTAAGSVPLVRYKILDRVGVVPHARMRAFLRERGFERSSQVGRELPFVYVYGRSSFAVSFYGANVYPENVAPALEQRELASRVTGKFVMHVVHDDDKNAMLEVFVELAGSASADESTGAALARAMRSHLERLNSEFANYTPAERRTPKVVLLAEGHPEYFPVGVKHRYTRG